MMLVRCRGWKAKEQEQWWKALWGASIEAVSCRNTMSKLINELKWIGRRNWMELMTELFSIKSPDKQDRRGEWQADRQTDEQNEGKNCHWGVIRISWQYMWLLSSRRFEPPPLISIPHTCGLIWTCFASSAPCWPIVNNSLGLSDKQSNCESDTGHWFIN